MNKKLLLTSALVGSLAVAGSAIAETKIYGDLEQVWASSSRDLAANKQSGSEGYGSEANIGMSASKDIDLGTLNYGFKFEGDGDNTFDQSEHYLEVTSGAFTFHLNNDAGSAVSLDGTVVPHVGDQNDTLASRAGSDATSSGFIDVNGGAYVAGSLDVADGKLTLLRSIGDTGTDSGTLGSTSTGSNGDNGWLVAYQGSLGVEGLKVQVGRSEVTKADGDSGDKQLNKMGASYKVGPFAVGVDYQDYEDGKGVGASNNRQQIRYGASYNVSDDLSVGVVYNEVEVQNSTTSDAVNEEVTTLAVGYNLGGLGVKLYVSQIDNLGGTSGDDAQVIQIQTKQSF